jgi:hypothetical protein
MRVKLYLKLLFSHRKTFLNDLAPLSAFPVELASIGETRDGMEQKLDSIFNLAPFMASRF